MQTKAAGVTPNSPIIIGQSAIPWTVANSGTVAANGIVTLGTALPTTYSNPGIWMYFPAAAFSVLPAGWYWAVMSSTTAGTVYTDRTLATTVVGTGIAYTGVTGAVVFQTFNFPGGFMGNNGRLQLDCHFTANNSAGTKAVWTLIAGVFSDAASTSGANTNGSLMCYLANRGTQVNQVMGRRGHVANTSPTSYTNQSTAVAWAYTLNINCGVATDYAVVEAWCLEFCPGPA